jgi:hypothetical protein
MGSGRTKTKKQRGRGRATTATKPVRLPRTFDASTTTADSLDTLLHERYHGAVNIRGIRFQVRYAMLRGVEMAHAVRTATSPAPTSVATRVADSVRGISPAMAGASTDSLHQPLLRVEGIEDVDVADPSLGPLRVLGQQTHAAGEYVQVKTAVSPWSWGKLKEPLVGWIELYRTAAAGITFRLVVNFEPTGDLAHLAHFFELPRHQQWDIRRKFRRLGAKLGATDTEADGVLERLVIERITDDDLRSRLRTILTEAFSVVDGGALDAFELALTGRFLRWSEERAVIRAVDVLAIGQALGEGLAKQGRFQAIAHGLIGPVDFSPDATPDDFFSGRRTRLGHVVDGLDVRRPEWLDRVDAALTRAGVCVLRAPSGHGKSTLAFRYVVEQWPASQTLVVRSAQTPEEVASLSDYLRHRRKIGLPVRVLIDADYRTRLWPEVAAVAASVGAQVLVTVRTEDYQRYPLYALTRREIIEPTLSLEEAARIFAEFARRGHVAANVLSAAWAYEQLRRPPLLLEYVYLITHGVMLEDRLREQVHSFSALGEDPAKQDVLRLVSLASALGAPIRLEPMLGVVTLRDDPQDVLRPLVGEYLVVEEGLVSGLHWVRSEHLARVLHDGGIPPVHQTALRLLPLVPASSLPFVIANALSWQGLDRTAFVKGLVDQYRTADTTTLVSVVEGLYEAGEREFFIANRAPFDDANMRMGFDGMLLLWSETAPLMRVDTSDRMIQILGEKAGAFPQYKAWAEQVRDGPRGLDLVRTFLQAVADSRSDHMLQPDGATGRLLDWCAVADVRLPHWSEARGRIVAQRGACALALDDALDLVQGLYRYDREAFEQWFDCHGDAWLAYLQRKVSGLAVTLLEPTSVQTELARARNPEWIDSPEAKALEDDARHHTVEDVEAASKDAARHGEPTADVDLLFAVPHDSESSIGDETRWRLDLLRRAIPFAGRYFTQGDFLLPTGFVLPVDDTTKAVPRWNLPLPSDVAKNRVWGDVVTRAYLPDSFYQFQERWVAARRAALRVVRGLNRAITRALQGRPVDAEAVFGSGDTLAEFEGALRDVPWLSAEHFATLGQPLSDALAAHLKEGAPNKWRNSMQTFLRQFVQYFGGLDEHIGRLAVMNFRDAASALSNTHAFFAAMFLDAPDYFSARVLNDEELAAYGDLAVLLVGRITDPVPGRLEHPVAELRERQARRAAGAAATIASALQPVVDAGRTIVAPRAVVFTGCLKAVVIGVDVQRVEAPIDDLLPVLDALQSVADVVDWFYLVPIRGGERLSDGAYGVSARRLRSDADVDSWDERETAIVALSLSFPTDVPPEVIPHLPELPLARILPERTIVQRAIGLHTMAEIFARRCEQIHAIGGDTPLPDHVALRSELHASLAEVGAELSSAAATLRTEVELLSSASAAYTRAGAKTLRDLAYDVEKLVANGRSVNAADWRWTVEQVEYAARTVETALLPAATSL